jgi:hypothetical protein
VAYQLHQNVVAGSLEPKKYSDLLLLGLHPLVIAPEGIARTKVVEIVDGVMVHKNL